MIRGLVLDIDGVLVGEKIGFNSPWPHPDVIRRLKGIRATGIPIILSTGKPHFSIEKIITDCRLDTPHVVNNGAIIIDPMHGRIIKKHVMDPTLVTRLIRTFLDADMYVEVYTPDAYMIQKSQYRDNLTPVHAHVLQREPIMVDNLAVEAEKHDIIKVMPVATDETDWPRLMALFAPFAAHAELSLGLHPVANPHQFGGITAKGVSKRQSTLDALECLSLGIRDCLGVGDSASDWQFMELTGFSAAIGNAADKLKVLVRSMGKTGYIAERSVDENGILPILDHFGL